MANQHDLYTGEMWFSDDPEYRTGVRLWGEVDGYLEIVYQEFDNETCTWKDDTVLPALSKKTFERMYKSGMFILEMEKSE